MKYRLYSKEQDSSQKMAGQFTIYRVILNSLKLFAPIAPFITEEIYHSIFFKDVQIPSIHLCSLPKPCDEKKKPSKKVEKEIGKQLGDLAISIISALRRDKSDKGIPLNAPIKRVIILYHTEDLGLEQVKNDIVGTLKINELIITTKVPTQKLKNHFEMVEEKLEIYWEL